MTLLAPPSTAAYAEPEPYGPPGWYRFLCTHHAGMVAGRTALVPIEAVTDEEVPCGRCQ